MKRAESDEPITFYLKNSLSFEIHHNFILIRRFGVSICYILLTKNLKYEFVGDGIFSISFSNKNHLYFRTEKLHDLWGLLVSIERTLEDIDIFQKPELNISLAYQYGDFIWLSSKEDLEIFKKPVIQEDSTTPTSSSATYIKPDLEIVSKEIQTFIKTHNDPDDLTLNDIITHLKNVFGGNVIGKYGFTKQKIENLTWTFWGQLERPSQIDEDLYLGSQHNAADREELLSLGISHILNVTSEVEKFFPKDFQYQQINVLDVPSVDLLPFFPRALSFIDSAIQQQGKVFVHCQRGVSRSATFVIAHMMKRKKWQLVDALKHVKERRKIVHPNTGFIKQLKDWEKFLEEQDFEVDSSFELQRVSKLLEKHNKKKNNQGSKKVVCIYPTKKFSVYGY